MVGFEEIMVIEIDFFFYFLEYSKDDEENINEKCVKYMSVVLRVWVVCLG